MKYYYVITLACLLGVISCQKPDIRPNESLAKTAPGKNGTAPGQNSVASILTETFETGAKAAYALGNVTLTTGVWSMDDALIGNSASDLKSGVQSVRVRNSGKLAMGFDKTGGAGIVSISHGRYGTDTPGTWELWYSAAGGAYAKSGSAITTGTTLAISNFTVNISGNVRIEIRKTDGSASRINFDNITINDYSATNPAPTLGSISPTSAMAGTATFTLTANGTNYISGSTINWNGTALSTTYVSAIKLTASVPASLITSAGTASVTVFTPTPGGGTSTSSTCTISAASTSKRFLFDATHAETAGNADWVIDEDGSVPQRVPTPAQSTITSTTAPTYWTGALSSWGIALVKKGHFVETLPSSGSITYGNSSNTQDLSNYDVFVVDEPNTVFTSAQKTAILTFVQNGGGLIMISDHTVSDRNNDGWDSPAIWNDLFTNNTIQSNPFGMSVSLTNLSGTTTNILSSPSNTILHGSAGNVGQIEYNNGASLTINTTANPTVQGLIWKSGVTQNTTNVFCASSTFGTGRVFMITDSSPMDDGTGASGNTLFPGWTDFNHSQLMLNASYWVAKAP